MVLSDMVQMINIKFTTLIASISFYVTNGRQLLLKMIMVCSFANVMVDCSCGAAEKQFILARNGNSQAIIVISDKASEAERHAANELSYFLNQMTGTEFLFVNQYHGPLHRIFVGPDASELLEKDSRPRNFANEELSIYTIGQDLVLTGGRPHGTLYAVYTFLDMLGCRWWSSNASSIPKKRILTIPQLEIHKTPLFELREPCWKDAMDADWAVRNKVNGTRTAIDAKRGGKYIDFGGGHSFYSILPPDKYFDAHPEWYSLVDGKRIRDKGQLCLTNGEMACEFIKNIKDRIRNQPGLSTIWAGQMDWQGYCQCEKCRVIDEREGTPAGSIICFVNGVAAEVEKEFPDVTISTFAYDYSQKPPQNIKVRGNIIVWLCTTGCSFAHPLTNDKNRQFRDCLDGWAKVCNRIYIFDYTTNFAHYLCPHPNIRTLAPNVKYYAEHNVKGVFSLGAFTSMGAEMAELRAWVLAKLFWDPTRDGNELIGEFLDGYYGPASGHVKSYLNVFHDAFDASGDSLSMYEIPTGENFLNISTLSQGLNHLREGKAAAISEQRHDVVKRLDVAELPLLYVFLLRWDELKLSAVDANIKWPFQDESIDHVYRRFNTIVKENNITEFSEAKARDWYTWIEERVAAGDAAAPPGCEDISPKLWADMQEVGFTLKEFPDVAPLAKIVIDQNASNSRAVCMRGNSDLPAVERHLWNVPLVQVAKGANLSLRCKISIRCNLTGKAGMAFKCGISELWKDDPAVGKSLEVEVSKVKDGQYYTYDLGVFNDLTGWKYVWVSKANNPDNVTEIYIDRIWLVKE